MKLSSDKGENWFYILTIYIIHACMHCIRPCIALLLKKKKNENMQYITMPI